MLLAALTSTAVAADATPLAGAETYLKALYAQDASAVQDAAIGDAAQRDLLKGQIEYVAVEAKFREILLAAFPAAAAELPEPKSLIPIWLRNAKTETRGDTATVTLADSLQRLEMRKDAGVWKVDLAALYPTDAAGEFVRFRGAIVKAMQSLTPDIKARMFVEYEDVKRELDTRVKVQLAVPLEDKPATQPTP